MNLMLVMEYDESFQDLFDFVNERGKLSEEIAQSIFSQLVTTVHQFNKYEVFHSDLKDENILVHSDRNSEEYKIKIIDFGSGQKLHENLYRSFSGTLIYAPPEWLILRLFYLLTLLYSTLIF